MIIDEGLPSGIIANTAAIMGTLPQPSQSLTFLNAL